MPESGVSRQISREFFSFLIELLHIVDEGHIVEIAPDILAALEDILLGIIEDREVGTLLNKHVYCRFERICGQGVDLIQMRQDILDRIVPFLFLFGHLFHLLDTLIDVVDHHHGRLPLNVSLHLLIDQRRRSERQ